MYIRKQRNKDVYHIYYPTGEIHSSHFSRKIAKQHLKGGGTGASTGRVQPAEFLPILPEHQPQPQPIRPPPRIITINEDDLISLHDINIIRIILRDIERDTGNRYSNVFSRYHVDRSVYRRYFVTGIRINVRSINYANVLTTLNQLQNDSLAFRFNLPDNVTIYEEDEDIIDT